MLRVEVKGQQFSCPLAFSLPPSPAAAAAAARPALQVYLVGDPVQLPATVISSTALEQGYDVSMFKRLQASGYPVNVLDVQYRMHPAISLFPSREFYQGRLKDGEVGTCLEPCRTCGIERQGRQMHNLGFMSQVVGGVLHCYTVLDSVPVGCKTLKG